MSVSQGWKGEPLGTIKDLIDESHFGRVWLIRISELLLILLILFHVGITRDQKPSTCNETKAGMGVHPDGII